MRNIKLKESLNKFLKKGLGRKKERVMAEQSGKIAKDSPTQFGVATENPRRFCFRVGVLFSCYTATAVSRFILFILLSCWRFIQVIWCCGAPESVDVVSRVAHFPPLNTVCPEAATLTTLPEQHFCAICIVMGKLLI
jgi:hypothetical protein